MRLRRATAMTGALFLTLGLATPATATPVIEQLPIAPGRFQGFARDINSSGTIAGDSSNGSGGGIAARWNNGTLASLQPLPGTATSRAYGINETGTVVGTSDGIPTRWSTDGTVSALAMLAGYTYGQAQKINDSGVAVGTALSNTGPIRAVRWNDAGVVEQLTTTSWSSWAYDINSAGVVAGDHGNNAAKWHPDGSVEQLTSLPGFHTTVARAINVHGVIVGAAYVMGSDGKGRFHAVRWNTDGTVTFLDAVPGETYSYARGINSGGFVVGDIRKIEGGVPVDRAVQWAPDGTVTELATLPGHSWAAAAAVNDAGVIVGSSGTTSSSNPVRWVP